MKNEQEKHRTPFLESEIDRGLSREARPPDENELSDEDLDHVAGGWLDVKGEEPW